MAREPSTSSSGLMGDRAEGDAAPESYRLAIRAAYEGELLGRSFFCEMSDLHQDDLYARRAFWLLARLELEVGRMMRGLLRIHGTELSSPEPLAVRGREIAAALDGLTWEAKLAAMAQRIEAANLRFVAMLEEAPKSDKAVVSLLVEHERALAAFAKDGVSRRNTALKEAVRCLRVVRSHFAVVGSVETSRRYPEPQVRGDC